MFKLLLLALVQSLSMATSQVLLKIAMQRAPKLQLTWECLLAWLTHWPLLGSGISVAIASVTWLYMLKHYEFSLVYPLASLSYVFALVAAVLVWHEAIPLTRWVGVAIIMVGIYFVAKS